MNKQIKTAAICLLCGLFIFDCYGRDLRSDTWIAADSLGRVLPSFDECGAVRSDKTVGVFYFLWHDTASRTVYDITNLLALDPYDPSWGSRYAFHYWGEPELGYYIGTDPYVLRRHASMLTDAGVDMVFFDVGNALVYTPVYMKLCEVWQQMRAEGETTPQICFQARANAVTTVRKLYDDFYAKNLYPDLWFYWKGKPLMLSPLSGHSQEVLDFFTMRDSWAWQSGQYKWTWVDHYPQRYGWDLDSSVPEQTSVSIAQHATTNIGRSFNAAESWGSGNQPPYNEYKLTGTEELGIYFDKQWQGALARDPEILFITGWNEWIAQRFISGLDGSPSFLGVQTQEGDTFFVDQFNQEYSRDAEPMKDGHTDNYYYQMIDGIRRYKGVSQQATADEARAITIDGSFSDWNNVNLTYYDTYNDTIHRNWPGCENHIYTNTTGRNDIVESKVAFDAYKVYFYVETVEKLTSNIGDNWMLLYINSDCDYETGWEGYDYVVNQFRCDEFALLERILGNSWELEPVAMVKYAYSGKGLELAIPRNLIEQDNKKYISFDFKWADNIQSFGDITEFSINGDSAPNRRFNYRYEKLTSATYFNQDGDFEGWSLTNNLANGSVANGVLSCDITGSDSYMINWIPLNAPASVYRYIHIRMKNLSSGGLAQVYWTTIADSIMNDNKHKDFAIVANDNQFRDYWLDMGSSAYWSETVRLLRFDPTSASSGSVEIDFVRVADRMPECGDFGYDLSDMNRDCYVDLTDLAVLASDWVE